MFSGEPAAMLALLFFYSSSAPNKFTTNNRTNPPQTTEQIHHKQPKNLQKNLHNSIIISNFAAKISNNNLLNENRL